MSKRQGISPIQTEPVLPLGLYFRQITPWGDNVTEETTHEPEPNTGDGKDPNKVTPIWLPDEDENDEDDDDDDDE